MGKIQVHQDTLHAAGSRVSGYASQLQDGRGIGGAAAASAASSAAHPDAQEAISSYWARTESKLGMTYALINALSSGLHESADNYGATDQSVATRFEFRRAE